MLTTWLFIILFLILLSEFVNGWTDAPNSIATVVSTKAMKFRHAVIMAAVFNFLGVLLMGTAVANTIGSIVNLTPGNNALAVVAAAQIGIIFWGIFAWKFGIPTSESHALIAGLTGAGLAVSSTGGLFGLESVNWNSWIKVLQGLLISSFLGLFVGLIIVSIISFIWKKHKPDKFFTVAQIISAAAMSFSHGAQDGQKFMGIFARALVFAGVLSLGANGSLEVPIWIVILCSLVMAVGTSIGGYRIIKKMGMEMVQLKKYQGFAVELSASLCLLTASLLGIPVSTTHTKYVAMIGVGMQKGKKHVDWRIVKQLGTAWILTFPICGAIGFAVSKFILSFMSN